MNGRRNTVDGAFDDGGVVERRGGGEDLAGFG